MSGSTPLFAAVYLAQVCVAVGAGNLLVGLGPSVPRGLL